MSTSNQLFKRNVPALCSQLNPWKNDFLIDKNYSYNHRRTCDLSNTNTKKYSYVKMIVESYDTLNKSQAIEFLRQASSTESKLSLLDAMKDKVSLSTKEIDELVPSINSTSSSSSMTDVSSFGNLSYLSLLLPQQQQSPHIFTSFNNGAQPTRRSSDENKRSSLLHHLFGRHTSRKSTSIVNKQPLKISQQTNKRRIISSGDQVKLSSTKINYIKKSYQPISSYDVNIQGDVIDNQSPAKDKMRFSLQGLRYDFKQIKNTSSIKQSAKTNLIPIPFTRHSSFIQDKSLSSLSDPTSMRQHIKEQKQNIQSAHDIDRIPKMKSTNTILEKISFNADQHKYHTQTPNYNYSKRLSAIELLAKQYSLPLTSQNSNGLFWYNPTNQETMNKTISFSKHIHNIPKKNNRNDSSSDSRDTSSSSNTSSSSSSSTKAPSNKTSSSSSTTSSNQTSSTESTTQSKPQKTIKQPIVQYNRNQNDKDDIIRIDLNSSTSRTSTSTSISTHPCHQRFISRTQLSTTSSNTTTNTNDNSSSSSSSTTTTNTHQSIINPPVSNGFSTINQLKVKRQRI